MNIHHEIQVISLLISNSQPILISENLTEKMPEKSFKRQQPSIRAAILLSLLIMLPLSNTAAQQSPPPSPIHFSLGYSGNNLWNPGMRISADRSMRRQVESNANQPSKNIFVWSGTSGIYLDPGSHAGLSAAFGPGLNHYTRRSGRISLAFHPAGIYRSFLGETYRVEDETVERVPLAGNLYYAPSASFQVGTPFNRNLPGDLFAGLHLTILIPYNTYVMPLLNVDIGYRFRWKGGSQ